MIHAHRNSDCIKCLRIELTMLRIGAFVMCNDCAKEEFKTDDPPRKEKSTYTKWLQKYKERHA